MFSSTVHLAIVEAERRHDMERRRLARAAPQVRPAQRPALGSVLSFAPRRWFVQRTDAPSHEASSSTTVPACC